MRRFLLGMAAAMVSALVGVPAASAQPPQQDYVSGTPAHCFQHSENGTECLGKFTMTFDAHSGPAGEDPAGTVDYVSNEATPDSNIGTHTTVTCLSVRRNVAVIGVTGDTLFGPFYYRTTTGLIRVTDGGPGSSADKFEFATTDGDVSVPLTNGHGENPPPTPPPGPTDCSGFPGATGRINDFACVACTNDLAGDAIVIDAQPLLPTGVRQCFGGAFAQFGFKNTGQCVRFVVLTRVCSILDRYRINTKYCRQPH